MAKNGKARWDRKSPLGLKLYRKIYSGKWRDITAKKLIDLDPAYTPFKSNLHTHIKTAKELISKFREDRTGECTCGIT